FVSSHINISMKNLKILFTFLCFIYSTFSFAQKSFPEKCLGEWEGMMYIYSNGSLVDSVSTSFDVARTEEPHTFTWITSYHSPTQPMVKDYKLKLIDAEKKLYAVDEGNSIALHSYLFDNKLYSVFETQGILLTSSYELMGENLVFEVTSGTNLEPGKDVMNYSVRNLQRVVFKKKKE
ncbi:MAG: hypothetical protein AAF705_15465, partial [Bacteroidota bacterium]